MSSLLEVHVSRRIAFGRASMLSSLSNLPVLSPRLRKLPDVPAPAPGGSGMLPVIGAPAPGGKPTCRPVLGAPAPGGKPAFSGGNALPQLGTNTPAPRGKDALPLLVSGTSKISSLGPSMPAPNGERMLNMLPPLGTNTPATNTPASGGALPCKRKHTAIGQNTDVCSWRANAYDDLETIGNLYGKDLVSCPPHWLNEADARTYLKDNQIIVPGPNGETFLWGRDPNGTWEFWEIYSGCANATEAFVSPATGGGVAGPPVDKLPSRWPKLPTFDLLRVDHRRLLWALLVVFAPLWVHMGPPCTFWSTLSRRCNKRTLAQNEQLRLEALVHIVLSIQICQYQQRCNRFCSFEQPLRARSWHLDIVQNMLGGSFGAVMPASGGTGAQPMKRFNFDSWCWGHRDPGNGKLYKKAQSFASNADMSKLCFTCAGGHDHQKVEGTVSGGPRHGRRRSQVAGEYPMDFCLAWAKLIKRCCRPRAV